MLTQPVFASRDFCAGLFRALQGAQAFDKHQGTNCTKEDNITKLNQQIDLSKRAQVVEYRNAHRRAKKPADQQNRSHPQVNGLAFEVRQQTRNRRSHNLVGASRNRDRWWNAYEKEERGH